MKSISFDWNNRIKQRSEFTFGNCNAFTLVELLVVIMIIAVLASMLLPALKVAKDMAQRTTCLANTKSIGTGVFLYGENYDSYFPKEYLNDRNQPLTSWMQQVYGALRDDPAQYDPLTTGKSFWCPTVPVTAKIKEYLKIYINKGNSGVTPLAFNGNLLAENHHPLFRIRQSKTPSICGVVADIERIIARGFGASGAGMISLRHTEKCNVFFLDGHASSVRTSQYQPPGAYSGRFSAQSLSYTEFSVNSPYNWLNLYQNSDYRWLLRFYAEAASDHDFYSSENGNHR